MALSDSVHLQGLLWLGSWENVTSTVCPCYLPNRLQKEILLEGPVWSKRKVYIIQLPHHKLSQRNLNLIPLHSVRAFFFLISAWFGGSWREISWMWGCEESVRSLRGWKGSGKERGLRQGPKFAYLTGASEPCVGLWENPFGKAHSSSRSGRQKMRTEELVLIKTF